MKNERTYTKGLCGVAEGEDTFALALTLAMLGIALAANIIGAVALVATMLN